MKRFYATFFLWAIGMFVLSDIICDLLAIRGKQTSYVGRFTGQPLLVLSFVSLPSHTSFMQMILSSSSLSFPKKVLLLSPTQNLLYLSYFLGCHLTTSPLILQKLNFSLLDFHSKLPKSSTYHFPSISHNLFLPLPLPRTLDLSFTLTCLFANKFHPFLAPANTTFVTSVISVFTTAATIATFLVHSRLDIVTLFTMDFLSCELSVVNKFKMHLPALSSASPNIPTLLPHLNSFNGSKLSNVYI